MADRRVAIVTGAAGGIGQAMVKGLLGAGHDVVATDRHAPAIEPPAGGGEVLELACDLAHPTAADTILRATLDRFGRVDILVNNAGIGTGTIRPDYWRKPVKFWEITPELYRAFLAVNTVAPFLLSCACAPHMIRQGFGRIVNVTTSLGTMIRAGYLAYGSSKAGLEAQTASIAGDLEGSGVTANVLVPGGVTNTGMVPSEAGFERDALLQPDVMVPPLLWLVSPAAAAVNARRFLAVHWDTSLPPDQAAEKAGAPAAWQALAVLPITPGR
jgi:NAD(P)-dependent dehydrogenase (short-subunit alcohol dehydrogenase family)